MSVWEAVDQEVANLTSVKYTYKKCQSGLLPEQSAIIKAWRDRVVAADARKAESASDGIPLT